MPHVGLMVYLFEEIHYLADGPDTFSYAGFVVALEGYPEISAWTIDDRTFELVGLGSG